MARVAGLCGLGAFQVDWAPILGGLAVLTMSVGNVIALRQRSVKRMLADALCPLKPVIFSSV